VSALEFTPQGDAEKAMWDWMKNRFSFTTSEVCDCCDVSEWKRQNFMSKLRRDGRLFDAGRIDGVPLYTAHDPERAQQFAAKKRKSVEGVIWAAMRSQKVFTPEELGMTVGTGEHAIGEVAVKKYISVLLSAKYLSVLEKAKPGVRSARYRLINDTGPLPPKRKTKTVLVDGNEERVVYVSGEVL
jgi:hypothetical protein